MKTHQFELPEHDLPREARLTQTDLHRIHYYKQMAATCKQRLAEQQKRASPDAECMEAEKAALRSIGKEIDRLSQKLEQL